MYVLKRNPLAIAGIVHGLESCCVLYFTKKEHVLCGKFYVGIKIYVRVAEKIFNLLPIEQKKEFMLIWKEFEERKTKESKFANAIDRFEPILQNYKNKHIINIKVYTICYSKCIFTITLSSNYK